MSFTFNGISSETLGINITRRDVYNTPAFDISGVEVPGRSGEILTSNERFKNKIVEYTGFIRSSSWADLSQKIRAINTLHSLTTFQIADPYDYRELTDTYDPGYTRMAYLDGEIKISPVQDRFLGATVTIRFNCQPFMRAPNYSERITSTTGTININNPYNIASLPRILIEATASTAEFRVSSSYFNGTYTLSGMPSTGNRRDITFDSEAMEVRNGNNELVGGQLSYTVDYNYPDPFPRLCPGATSIVVNSNISSVTVWPRWRVL